MTRRDACEGVRRLVAFHEEMLNTRLFALHEDPAPFDGARSTSAIRCSGGPAESFTCTRRKRPGQRAK